MHTHCYAFFKQYSKSVCILYINIYMHNFITTTYVYLYVYSPGLYRNPNLNPRTWNRNRNRTRNEAKQFNETKRYIPECSSEGSRFEVAINSDRTDCENGVCNDGGDQRRNWGLRCFYCCCGGGRKSQMWLQLWRRWLPKVAKVVGCSSDMVGGARRWQNGWSKEVAWGGCDGTAVVGFRHGVVRRGKKGWVNL